MKGQAISPPHNYPVLKQESGIDWPGSVLCDWTAGALPWLGWARPLGEPTAAGCTRGPALSPPRAAFAGDVHAAPGPARGRTPDSGAARLSEGPAEGGWSEASTSSRKPPRTAGGGRSSRSRKTGAIFSNSSHAKFLGCPGAEPGGPGGISGCPCGAHPAPALCGARPGPGGGEGVVGIRQGHSGRASSKSVRWRVQLALGGAGRERGER